MARFVRTTLTLLCAGALVLPGTLLATAARAADSSSSPSPIPAASSSSTANPSTPAASTPSSSASAGSSAASASVPGAPSILSIKPVPTGRTLVVTVRPPSDSGSSPVLRYDMSLNGESWLPCPDGSTTCTLTSLQNDVRYFVVVRAVNSVGPGVPSASSSGVARVFDPAKPESLPKPRRWVSATFNAASNSLGVEGASVRLGVGTLPKVTFSSPITDKKVVESHMRVTATEADGRVHRVKGAWGWVDDRSVVYRPEKYWPGNATINIQSSLGRAVMGKYDGKYLVGREALDTVYTFRTDRRLIIKVDGEKVNMKVYVDGVKKKVFPISLGKSEWETRNGVKVISTQKEPTHTYTSTSLGLDPSQEEPYELKDIPWNTRLTPTGEFIHSAPWAASRIGRYNGSHGCTNMHEADAKWIYDKTIPGDVVIYENTGGETVQPWNGPGGLWNIPWENWLKKSALGNASGTVIIDDTKAPTSMGQSASA